MEGDQPKKEKKKGRKEEKGAHIHMSLKLNWISGNPVAAHRLEIRTWNVLVSQETDHHCWALIMLNVEKS